MRHQVNLTFFGSAAGFPTKARPHTTSVGLWRGSSLHLFDAGDGVAAQLARMDIQPNALREIFLTHFHADHVGGLPMLIQWLQLNERAAPLPIYVPDASLPGLRDFLHLLYLYPLADFDLTLLPVRAGLTHDTDGLSVTALPSHHLEPGAERRAERGERADSQALSYLVRAEGKTIYLSGDLAGPEEAAKQADSADVAVVELAHFTAEELGAALSATALPRLVLTHISDDFEPFEEEIPARVRAAGFQGDVVVVKDGDEVVV
jgi:ribonuclease BN (tRNA processing enzyme)